MINRIANVGYKVYLIDNMNLKNLPMSQKYKVSVLGQSQLKGSKSTRSFRRYKDKNTLNQMKIASTENDHNFEHSIDFNDNMYVFTI